jgi:hypothetical protein
LWIVMVEFILRVLVMVEFHTYGFLRDSLFRRVTKWERLRGRSLEATVYEMSIKARLVPATRNLFPLRTRPAASSSVWASTARSPLTTCFLALTCVMIYVVAKEYFGERSAIRWCGQHFLLCNLLV